MTKSSSTMTAAEFKTGLLKLYPSIYAGGPAIGLSLRQAQRIACGEAPVPAPVAKLIRLARLTRTSGDKLARL